jgi:hypothetical protein
MSVCNFVAGGSNFQMEKYLRETPFQIQKAFVKSEADRLREGNHRPDLGVIVSVRMDEEPDLRCRFRDAIQFLNAHEKDIARLRRYGAETMFLDFGMEQQHLMLRPEYLPPDLIAALSGLGMGVSFSLIQLPNG